MLAVELGAAWRLHNTASQRIVFQDATVAPGWKGVLYFEGLAAPHDRAIDAALKLGYDVTPNVAIAGGYRISLSRERAPDLAVLPARQSAQHWPLLPAGGIGFTRGLRSATNSVGSLV